MSDPLQPVWNIVGCILDKKKVRTGNIVQALLASVREVLRQREELEAMKPSVLSWNMTRILPPGFGLRHDEDGWGVTRNNERVSVGPEAGDALREYWQQQPPPIEEQHDVGLH